jgi:hypothetical protein
MQYTVRPIFSLCPCGCLAGHICDQRNLAPVSATHAEICCPFARIVSNNGNQRMTVMKGHMKKSGITEIGYSFRPHQLF